MAPLPRDAQGWTIFTPSEPKQDGYTGGAGPAGTLMIHVDDTNGFDTEGTGGGQGNGSSAHPYKTIAKGLSRIRNGSPDWLRLRMGTQYVDQSFGTVHMHGRSATEPMVFGAYHPSVPLDPNPGASFGAQPLIILPPDLNTWGLTGFSVASGIADLSYFYITALEFYLRYNDPTNNQFFRCFPQVVTFNISTNVVTFPAGTSQTNAIVNEQPIWFFGSNLPAPLVDAGVNLTTTYFLISAGGGNTFTIQLVRLFSTQPECRLSTTENIVLFTANGGYTRDPGIAFGETVTGTGIPANTTVTAVHPFEYIPDAHVISGNRTVVCDSPITGLHVGQGIKTQFSTEFPTGTRIATVGVPNQFTFTVDQTPTGSATGTIFFIDGVTLSNTPTTNTSSAALTFIPTAASAVDLTTTGSGTFTARLGGMTNSGGITYGGNTPGEVQPIEFYTEDCYFNCTNIGMEIEFAYRGNRELHIRRSRFYNCAGFHLHLWGGEVAIEENLFDVGGWIFGFPFGGGIKGAAQLLHNLYISGEPHTDMNNTACTQGCKPFQGNIFARDTADTQVRTGGDWIDNLCTSWGQHNWGTLIQGSQNSIAYNVYHNGPGDDPNGGGADFMSAYDTGADNNSYLRGDTLISENIFTYVGPGWNGQGYCGYSLNIGWDASLMILTATFTINNQISWGFNNIQGELPAAHPEVIHYTGFLSQFPSRAGVTGRNSFGTYPDPNRSLGTWMDEQFGGSGHTSLDFLVAARGQRKGNWDTRLTANTFNNYIRAGFGRPAFGGTVGPPPQQYHRVALTVTAA